MDKEVVDLLIETIQIIGPLMIIIDGLDECRNEDRHQVLDVLASLLSQTKSSILLSGRHDADISARFTYAHCLSLSDYITEDIEMFITAELAKRTTQKRLLDLR